MIVNNNSSLPTSVLCVRPVRLQISVCSPLADWHQSRLIINKWTSAWCERDLTVLFHRLTHWNKVEWSLTRWHPLSPGVSLQFYASYPADRRRWWFQMSSLCSGRQNSLDDWARRSRCSRSRSRSPAALENRGRPLNWEAERVLLSWSPDEESWPPADLEVSHGQQIHKSSEWRSYFDFYCSLNTQYPIC